jgi:hypothetical protein
MARFFCVRSRFAILSTLCAAMAASEDAQTSAEQPESVGVALMQTGRSALSVAAEKALRLGEFSVDSADDFATMEDEFDAGFDLPHAAASRRDWFAKTKQELLFVCAADHFGDPLLYLETLLVIGLFALARRAALWVQHARSEKSLPSPIEAPAVATESASDKGKELLVPSVSFQMLQKAICAGDEASCKSLLEQEGRAAVRLQDACSCTALHIAAHCGSAAMTRLLLGHGADVHAREAWEETPLHFAARVGADEVCALLLGGGSDIDAVNAQGQTPLLLAGEAQAEAACELLLSRGGGVAGVEDCSLAPFLKTLLFRRVLRGGAPSREPSEAEVRERRD